jgi:predicted nucleic acid-binding protein
MADSLFDTTIFIDYWRGETAAQTLINDMLDGRKVVVISPITAIELWQFSGLGRREELEYAALISLMEEGALDLATATEVGSAIRAYSRSQRRRLMGDAIIAITAKRQNLTVYSRNATDILRFYSRVISY